MKFFIYMLLDVVLGYIPQSAGCAIALYALSNQSIRTRKFWITTGIFSAIAILIRTIYNIKLIDFGFHTIIIWTLFVLVAIGYNKLPPMQAICSILLSGCIIAFAELIIAGILIIVYGNNQFNLIMNNTETLDGKISKAAWGVIANFLFVGIVLVFQVVRYTIRKKKNIQEVAEESNNS